MWYRPAMFGLAVAALAFAVLVWVARWHAAETTGAVGIDYRTFVDEGRRMLQAGTPYLPYQLAGPYEAAPAAPRLDPAIVPFLYPPTFAFVSLALLVVPWPLWWVAPLAMLGWAVRSFRPAPWTWPLMAACLAWPAVPSVVFVGGSTMWVVALVAVGLRQGWPLALLVLKPTFAPLALLGMHRRSWWVAVVVLGVASLALAPLWPQYLAAMRNASGVSLLYSLGDLPFVAVPLLAWAARTHESRPPKGAAAKGLLFGRRPR